MKLWPGPAENLESSRRGEKFWSQGRSTGRTEKKKLGSSSRCQLQKRQQCTSMTTRETAQLSYSKRSTGSRVREDAFFFHAALVRLQLENFICLGSLIQKEWEGVWRGSNNRLLTWPGGYSKWPSSLKSKAI